MNTAVAQPLPQQNSPALLPLWVLGEALIDCLVQANGLLQPLLGGSPYNLASAAALQGIPVHWLTPFSRDPFGQALASRLAEAGGHAVRPLSALPTSLAIVQLQQGQAEYSFYREGIADRDYTPADLIERLHLWGKAGGHPGVLHSGSLMAIPPEHKKVLTVFTAARQAGWTISVDLNLRPRVARDAETYRAAVHALAAKADWIKASDEDIGWLFNCPPPTRAGAAHYAQRWLTQRASRVALTFGAEGASLYLADPKSSTGWCCASAPVPQVTVVDTVGAGDTFWGSCLADWIEHAAPAPSVREASRAAAQAVARIETTLAHALRAAAINCTRAGCQPPTRAELR